MTTRLFIDVTRLAIPGHRHTGIARTGRELLDWFNRDYSFEVVPVLQEQFLNDGFDVSTSTLDPVLSELRDRVHVCIENESGGEVMLSPSPRSGDVFLSTHLPLPIRSATGDAKRAIIIHDVIHHPSLMRETTKDPVILQILDSIDITSDLVVVPSCSTLIDLMLLPGWESVKPCAVPWGSNLVNQASGAQRAGIVALLQPGGSKNAQAALDAIEVVLSDERFKAHDLTVIATGRMVRSTQDFLQESRLPNDRWTVMNDITDQNSQRFLGGPQCSCTPPRLRVLAYRSLRRLHAVLRLWQFSIGQVSKSAAGLSVTQRALLHRILVKLFHWCSLMMNIEHNSLDSASLGPHNFLGNQQPIA